MLISLFFIFILAGTENYQEDDYIGKEKIIDEIIRLQQTIVSLEYQLMKYEANYLNAIKIRQDKYEVLQNNYENNNDISYYKHREEIYEAEHNEIQARKYFDDNKNELKELEIKLKNQLLKLPIEEANLLQEETRHKFEQKALEVALEEAIDEALEDEVKMKVFEETLEEIEQKAIERAKLKTFEDSDENENKALEEALEKGLEDAVEKKAKLKASEESLEEIELNALEKALEEAIEEALEDEDKLKDFEEALYEIEQKALKETKQQVVEKTLEDESKSKV